MEKTWDQQRPQWPRCIYIDVNLHVYKITWLHTALGISLSLFSLQNVYAVLDLYGRITAVSIVSSSLVEDMESVKAPSLSSESCSEGEEDSTPVREVGDLRKGNLSVAASSSVGKFTLASCCLQQVETEPCALVPTIMAFLENHGKNIQLSNQNLTAARVSSYNQGLLVTSQPLARQQLFQVLCLFVCVCVRRLGFSFKFPVLEGKH